MNHAQVSFWPLNHMYKGRLKTAQVRMKELDCDLSCHCMLTRSLWDRVCSFESPQLSAKTKNSALFEGI